MKITQYKLNENDVLALNGEFDAQSVRDSGDELTNIINVKGKDVLVNMTDVSFIDSSGIGVIVYLFKRLRPLGRNLILVGVTGQPQKIMGMLRIDKTIDTYQNLCAYLDVETV